MDYASIENCLELLGSLGCDEVNRIIERMERGDIPSEISHLDSTEQQVILGELKAVMRVYNSRK